MWKDPAEVQCDELVRFCSDPVDVAAEFGLQALIFHICFYFDKLKDLPASCFLPHQIKIQLNIWFRTLPPRIVGLNLQANALGGLIRCHWWRSSSSCGRTALMKDTDALWEICCRFKLTCSSELVMSPGCFSGRINNSSSSL